MSSGNVKCSTGAIATLHGYPLPRPFFLHALPKHCCRVPHTGFDKKWPPRAGQPKWLPRASHESRRPLRCQGLATIVVVGHLRSRLNPVASWALADTRMLLRCRLRCVAPFADSVFPALAKRVSCNHDDDDDPNMIIMVMMLMLMMMAMTVSPKVDLVSIVDLHDEADGDDGVACCVEDTRSRQGLTKG